MIGVGYCIFRGAEATVQWIPRSWVSYSDEGDDPIWQGYLLAGTAALFCSLWLLDEMEKLAQKFAAYEWAQTLAERERVERDRGQ
jgi:hypothetical protein